MTDLWDFCLQGTGGVMTSVSLLDMTDMSHWLRLLIFLALVRVHHSRLLFAQVHYSLSLVQGYITTSNKRKQLNWHAKNKKRQRQRSGGPRSVDRSRSLIKMDNLGVATT
jgi:hypothetical protein